MKYFLSICIAILYAASAHAAARDFDIRLVHGTAAEQAAQAQLVRLLDTYDVSPFTATYSVRIDETAAPHSHPVLTLNDYFLEDDASALSTFLHEQMHWFSLFMGPQIDAAIQDLKTMYPDMPARGRGGGRNARETFLHMIVGAQELAATSSLIGRTEARRVIAGKTWYRWIYQEVLNREDELLTLLRAHELDLSKVPKANAGN